MFHVPIARQYLRILFSLLCLSIISSLFFACAKKPEVSGQVIDGFGLPVKDANVSITGTTFTGLTDSSGKYSIQYVPGSVNVNITKDGYTSASFSFSVATAADYPAQQTTIYKIPPSAGLFFFGISDYVPLAKGNISSVNRKVEISINDPDFYIKMGSGPYSEDTFTIVGQYTVVSSSSKLKFLVNSGPGSDLLKLFRVGENGVLLTRTNYISDHLNNAQVIETGSRNLGSLMVREVSLNKGKYVFANLGEAFRRGNDAIGKRVIDMGRADPVVAPIYLFEIK